MNKQEVAKARRLDIMQAVDEKDALGFDQIKKRFGRNVSDQTLRNDLREIDMLRKASRDPVTGGLVVNDLFRGTYFEHSCKTNREVKVAIAKALLDAQVPGAVPSEVVHLIDRVGGSMVVGPGSSTLAVLEEIAARLLSLEIMTCNFGIITVPCVMGMSIHLSGGWLQRDCACLVGTTSVRAISDFEADTAIVGVSGLELDERSQEVRLFAHHNAQIPTKHALIAKRKRVIVVTCGDKIGRRDPWPFGLGSQILGNSDFYLVTDEVPPDVRDGLCQWFESMSKPGGHKAALIEANRGKEMK